MNQISKHQSQDIIPVWDAVARSYEQKSYWANPANKANLQILLSHIGDPKGKRIIEVGCGSGFSTAALAESGAECVLLDISSEALKAARLAFNTAGLMEPFCYNEDALNSTVPSGAFDIVWNGGVIEHFDDSGKVKLVKEMLRMARPGGTVIIMVPNAWCWQFQLIQLWQKWRGRWAYGFEDDMSPRRLRMMCERIGLSDTLTYAFNPIFGWRWVPILRRALEPLKLNTVEWHCRRSWMGFVSVLVIKQ
jgi:ubiquinone/menaquinone biosynthesis C-methylase UbiE